MRVLATAVALGLVLSPTTSAAVEKKADKLAKQKFQEGQTAYDVGQFDEALTAYTEAYKLKALPAFLFNIAQCHRQLKNWERAAFFYRRYLKLSPNAPNADQTRELLAEVEKRAAEAPSSPAVATAPAPAETAPVPPPAAFVPPPSSAPATGPSAAGTTSPPPPAAAPKTEWSEIPTATPSAPAAPNPATSETASTRTVVAEADSIHVVPAVPIGETEKKNDKPVYDQAWFWLVVVGAVVVAAAATTSIVYAVNNKSGSAPCSTYSTTWCINVNP
jgi:tetratricopeptide (TPR) repeat protein